MLVLLKVGLERYYDVFKLHTNETKSTPFTSHSLFSIYMCANIYLSMQQDIKLYL